MITQKAEAPGNSKLPRAQKSILDAPNINTPIQINQQPAFHQRELLRRQVQILAARGVPAPRWLFEALLKAAMAAEAELIGGEGAA